MNIYRGEEFSNLGGNCVCSSVGSERAYEMLAAQRARTAVNYTDISGTAVRNNNSNSCRCCNCGSCGCGCNHQSFVPTNGSAIFVGTTQPIAIQSSNNNNGCSCCGCRNRCCHRRCCRRRRNNCCC